MGAFGLGVLQGFATSTDEALKTHIKDNKDRFDKNLEAALSRNLERSTRYDKKSREAQEALELVGGLTDGDLGRASEIIQGIGGVGQVQGFVDSFRKARQVDPTINLGAVVKYAESESGNLTPQQAIDQILKPFEFTVPAQAPRREGLAGLFDDPRSMAVELPKTLRERGLTSRGADDIIRRQGATIDWSKLRTQEQKYAARTAKTKIKQAEQTLELGAQNLAVARDKVANLGEDKAREIAVHESQMLDARLNRKDKTTRLLDFNRRNTPETAELARQKLVAEIIDKRSGNDAEEQWNILDSTQRVYENQLLERGDDQDAESGVLKAQIESITKSKAALVNTMAADASTVYSKDSPRAVFKESLETKLKSIMGTRFKDTLQGTIAVLQEGQGYQVLEAYRSHADEMGKLFSKTNHEGIRMQISIARQNARTAEKLIFQKIWSMKATPTNKPKNLFSVNKGTGLVEVYPKGHKDAGLPMINPALKPNDKVLINDEEMIKNRSAIYNDPSKGVWMGYNSKLAGWRK